MTGTPSLHFYDEKLAIIFIIAHLEEKCFFLYILFSETWLRGAWMRLSLHYALLRFITLLEFLSVNWMWKMHGWPIFKSSFPSWPSLSSPSGTTITKALGGMISHMSLNLRQFSSISFFSSLLLFGQFLSFRGSSSNTYVFSWWRVTISCSMSRIFEIIQCIKW